MKFCYERSGSCKGLTLIELLSVIFIIAMLVLMTAPAVRKVRDQVEKANCIANLRSLHTATSAFIQDNKHWPQIPYPKAHSKEHAKLWVGALSKYGVSHESWICPTVQKNSAGMDYTSEEAYRIDYIAMPFDAKEFTPFKWKSQPWFVERISAHGDGQLIIYPDGSIKSLNEVVPGN